MSSETIYRIYDTNSEALTFEQEIALLRAWGKRNKKKPSDEAIRCRDVLIKNYILFSVKKVRAMYKHLPQDSVMTVAHRALLLSIDGFNCDREKIGRLNSLIPWYARVANKELIREAQTVKCPVAKFEGHRFLHIDSKEYIISETHVDGGFQIGDLSNAGCQYVQDPRVSAEDIDALLGSEGSPLEARISTETRQAVIEALQEMTPAHRKIIELVYFKGLNFAEVARKLKPRVTREAVRQKHNKALQRIRDVVKEKGIFKSE